MVCHRYSVIHLAKGLHMRIERGLIFPSTVDRYLSTRNTPEPMRASTGLSAR